MGIRAGRQPSGRFNGAALFQVRKGANQPETRSEREKLQWGRTLSSAESYQPTDFVNGNCTGFNGAALFQVRKANINATKNLTVGCFNGAALFQVRKAKNHRRRVCVCYPASMGPHSFKCGKNQISFANIGINTRFNGAALFQVRKGCRKSQSGW